MGELTDKGKAEYAVARASGFLGRSGAWLGRLIHSYLSPKPAKPNSDATMMMAELDLHERRILRADLPHDADGLH